MIDILHPCYHLWWTLTRKVLWLVTIAFEHDSSKIKHPIMSLCKSFTNSYSRKHQHWETVQKHEESWQAHKQLRLKVGWLWVGIFSEGLKWGQQEEVNLLSFFILSWILSLIITFRKYIDLLYRSAFQSKTWHRMAQNWKIKKSTDRLTKFKTEDRFSDAIHNALFTVFNKIYLKSLPSLVTSLNIKINPSKFQHPSWICKLYILLYYGQNSETGRNLQKGP